MEWRDIWDKEFKKEYFVELKKWVSERREQNNVLPSSKDIMNAFKLCPFERVKVVIVGQDPYPNAQDAHGLSFSSKADKTPASLKNVFKAIHQQLYSDEKYDDCFRSNDLTSWAEQGVLLLNRVLTVDEGQPGSHAGNGWEQFTEQIIKILSKYTNGVVFMLWGSKAHEIEQFIINKEKHLIIKTVHPSPLSAEKGFFDNMQFRELQTFLMDRAFESVYWFLEDLLVKNMHYRSELKKLYDKTIVDLGSDEKFKQYLEYMLRTFARFPAMANKEISDNIMINFKTK